MFCVTWWVISKKKSLEPHSYPEQHVSTKRCYDDRKAFTWFTHAHYQNEAKPVVAS